MLTALYIAVASGVGAFTFCQVLCAPGMILERWPALAERYAPKVLHKPLFACPVCQAFWWALALLLVQAPDAPAWITAPFGAMFTAWALQSHYYARD